MNAPHIYKVEGVILKRRNVGEADRILTIFTKEYGKLRVIAKGIRRITSRRAPHLEVFGRALIMLHRGKSLDIVTEAELVDGYGQLRKDLTLVNIGYYYCELVDALLPEKQEHRDVYAQLTHAFMILNTGGNPDIYGECEHFAIELLRRLGFLPASRELTASQIQPFIENITERRLRTYQFIRRG